MLLLCDADIGQGEVHEHCPMDDAGQSLLHGADPLRISARALRRILKLSRTIADWEGAYDIQTHRLADAMKYCRLRQT
jgi:magnesium chelatase family protein